jgi:hypothetical protein
MLLSTIVSGRTGKIERGTINSTLQIHNGNRRDHIRTICTRRKCSSARITPVNISTQRMKLRKNRNETNIKTKMRIRLTAIIARRRLDMLYGSAIQLGVDFIEFFTSDFVKESRSFPARFAFKAEISSPD